MVLNSGDEIDPNKPYAELWMGTHESGPSVLVEDDEQNVGLGLNEWIENNPNVLGVNVLETWGSRLPFLFKVLSVGKALSIQAHPDKEMAKELHKMKPDVYKDHGSSSRLNRPVRSGFQNTDKDDNHKPEMALAITHFTALCGFISLQLVGGASAKQVMDIEEADEDGAAKLKSTLRSVLTQLMSASKEMTTKAISKLKTWLLLESQVRSLREKEVLVLELEKQYPGDIGVLSALFLNYMKLKPGEVLYLAANEPHTYLSGDCIECMLVLLPSIGYPEILSGLPLSHYITRYLPPFDEFEVDRCVLQKGSSGFFRPSRALQSSWPLQGKEHLKWDLGKALLPEEMCCLNLPTLRSPLLPLHLSCNL
ncbi:Mannose-6-phosphate isomerase 1 [Hibiscus syriacus]|uniref:mannose-6-phosphate isomerase n=1 Tax=Hibiscus syriacus TaxID=106335 RepID=A0A6A3BNX1_HIBSY|nr:Mannose-6-phosphate isomerase 1 [Hibiscus syriacus]